MQYKFYYRVQNDYTSFTAKEWNRYYFYRYFKDKKYSKAAMAGIWGNIVAESLGGNPGQVEGGQTIPTVNSDGVPTSAALRGGFGFIQWTDASEPYSNKLLNYSIDKNIAWYNGYLQCKLIYKELKNSESWYPRNGYNYTTKEYIKLTDYEEATHAYFEERVRGTWSSTRTEGAQAFMETDFSSVPEEPSDTTLSYTINNGSGGGGGDTPFSHTWLLDLYNRRGFL